MSVVESAYYKEQLAIGVQAEKVLAIRDKLVKKSRAVEELREYISSVTQPSHPTRVVRTGYVYKRLSDPCTMNHSAAFEVLSVTAALEVNKKERASLLQEIESLNKLQNTELRKLVDLQPDLSAIPELRLLLSDGD